MSDQPLYSTAGGDQRKKNKRKEKQQRDTAKPSSDNLKVRIESKGRGGKKVTVLFNLPFPKSEAVAYMKEMQAQFGCGASFKNGNIEFQGDVRERVVAFFSEKSMKVVLAGG